MYFPDAIVKAIDDVEVGAIGGDPGRGCELCRRDYVAVEIASDTVSRNRGDRASVDDDLADLMAAAIGGIIRTT